MRNNFFNVVTFFITITCLTLTGCSSSLLDSLAINAGDQEAQLLSEGSAIGADAPRELPTGFGNESLPDVNQPPPPGGDFTNNGPCVDETIDYAVALPTAQQHGDIDFIAEKLPGQSSKLTTIHDDGSTTVVIGLSNVLAEAMRIASPGDTIAVDGVLGELIVGSKQDSKAAYVWWPGDAPITNLTIISLDSNNPAIIDRIQFAGNVTQPGQGGSDNVFFKNVIIQNGGDDHRSAIHTWLNTKNGLIGFYNVKIRIKPGFESGEQGYGMRWNFRGHGRARYDIRGFECSKALEHCIYIDSPGYDGLGGTYLTGIHQNEAPTGRTTIQVVNRKNGTEGGVTGLGPLLIKDITAWTDSSMPSSGGGAITVAGHLGHVVIEDVSYSGDQAAVAVWTDAGKGVHESCGGFSHLSATLKNINVFSPSANKNHVKVAGAGRVDIHDFMIQGNKKAITLWDSFSGPIDNGEVWFHVPAPVSQYAGFAAAEKVSYPGNTMLTNGQIDQMHMSFE